MFNQTTDRQRKSVQLTEGQYDAFQAWVLGQSTKVDAAITLGVQRATLDRILAVKSGSPETIGRILQLIEATK